MTQRVKSSLSHAKHRCKNYILHLHLGFIILQQNQFVQVIPPLPFLVINSLIRFLISLIMSYLPWAKGIEVYYCRHN